VSSKAKWGIVALTAALLGISLAVVVLLSVRSARPELVVPWLGLIPLYVVCERLPIAFEFRREVHNLSLSAIPLALGGALLTPDHHLEARALSFLVVLALMHRQSPLKIAFNFSVGAFEVAAVAVGVSLVPFQTAGPLLWLGLLAGVAVGELVGLMAVSTVLRLADVRRNRAELLQLLIVALATGLICTTIAVIVLAAIATDPWTLLLVSALAGLLALGYRGYRRLVRQQEVTTNLYDFVKELGPLTPEDPQTRVVLGRVRALLHAHSLDLALCDGQGRPWTHLCVWDTEAEGALPAGGEDFLAAVAAAGTSYLMPKTALDEDRMAATVVGSAGMLGILTASGRLGNVRDFDRGDVRLLETIANELAAALERGSLMANLHASATVDPLTGVPNLNQTTVLLNQLLSREPAGVLLAALSVESFREVNDTLGHQVGDDLLLEVVRRLHLSHPRAIIGRIGGGRFAVAAPASTVEEDVALFGLGLRAQVEGGTQVGPVGTHIRLSVGVVRGPEHGREASTLLRRAETAMYGARNSHGGPVLWEPVYEVQGQRRLALVTALREALATGAIGVAYQPKVAAEGRLTTGVEALARWTHPALGSVSPDEFIPLAEASGLMDALTTTVLRQSLTACKGWQRRAGRVGVAVNVSADTVLDGDFVTEVAALLTTTGVPAELLTLELTEGIAVTDPGLAIERMRELRALGVKLSVDDFGTGYSSLTYLKSLPVDEVKIDKGFIDDVVSDHADQAVVRSVVDIAHTRGLRVVAEGVEQEDQHVLLQVLGVDEVQGYLHARPMPALSVATWLRRRESSAR